MGQPGGDWDSGSGKGGPCWGIRRGWEGARLEPQTLVPGAWFAGVSPAPGQLPLTPGVGPLEQAVHGPLTTAGAVPSPGRPRLANEYPPSLASSNRKLVVKVMDGESGAGSRAPALPAGARLPDSCPLSVSTVCSGGRPQTQAWHYLVSPSQQPLWKEDTIVAPISARGKSIGSTGRLSHWLKDTQEVAEPGLDPRQCRG